MHQQLQPGQPLRPFSSPPFPSLPLRYPPFALRRSDRDLQKLGFSSHLFLHSADRSFLTSKGWDGLPLHGRSAGLFLHFPLKEAKAIPSSSFPVFVRLSSSNRLSSMNRTQRSCSLFLSFLPFHSASKSFIHESYQTRSLFVFVSEICCPRSQSSALASNLRSVQGGRAMRTGGFSANNDESPT